MEQSRKICFCNELHHLSVSKVIVHHSPVGIFGQRGGRTVGSLYGLIWFLTSVRLFVIPDSRQCHHHVSRPSVSISTSHHPLSLMSWVFFFTAFMEQARVTPSHAANSKRASYSWARKATDNQLPQFMRLLNRKFLKLSSSNGQSSRKKQQCTYCFQCCQIYFKWLVWVL